MISAGVRRESSQKLLVSKAQVVAVASQEEFVWNFDVKVTEKVACDGMLQAKRSLTSGRRREMKWSVGAGGQDQSKSALRVVI